MQALGSKRFAHAHLALGATALGIVVAAALGFAILSGTRGAGSFQQDRPAAASVAQMDRADMVAQRTPKRVINAAVIAPATVDRADQIQGLRDTTGSTSAPALDRADMVERRGAAE